MVHSLFTSARKKRVSLWLLLNRILSNRIASDMQVQTQIIPPVTFLFGTLNYLYNTANNVANVRNPATETYVWADTNLGRVRGTKQVSRIGKSFYQFRGIPYAQAPIGDLRFEVSQQ